MPSSQLLLYYHRHRSWTVLGREKRVGSLFALSRSVVLVESAAERKGERRALKLSPYLTARVQ